MTRIPALLGVLLLAASPAAAQPLTPQSFTPGAVEEAQRAAQAERAAAEAAARAAATAAAEERRLAERRVEAARRAQAADQRKGEAEEGLAAARTAADAARAEGRARAEALAPMLPLMLRLGLWPAESLLAVPGPPEDRLRGLLVLQSLSRQLATEAASLRAAEAEAARRAAQAAERAAALREAEAQARAASAALDAELKAARDRRAGAEDAEEEAARRAAATAARATNLETALARLRQEQAREAAEARAREAAEARARAAAEARERAAAAQSRAEAAARARDAAELRAREAAEARSRGAEAEMATARTPDPPSRASGGRAMPVLGRITRAFGAVGEGGPSRGLTLQAATGARVVSPCGGRAVFAAPFRSFGQLLIVDCGDGYHVVLAGLDRLDAAPGQRLLAGEPVGQLGEAALYLELRRNGRPIDPRGWFPG
ncbi:peptidoglycan DD-metalloendopeptidase family protein [Belnapia sp. T18]|uniref:Peptidoglycan DD-metalloendopeptidase family protein n=1 Tax=Belnapia arida TaxID=2804533 RepID=A0ABS1U9U4_9PROT|nr:peptidoglycan DD-metalloendopeptidase family protein [Belnapia arida]MBL6081300.1 peptidoglycan DD-metalloendopeptidase family protein [Belnapia arida]